MNDDYPASEPPFYPAKVEPTKFDGHSPSPWEVNKLRIVSRTTGELIVLLPSVHPGAEDKDKAREYEANGELMAAAPDLLRERDELHTELKLLLRDFGSVKKERDDLHKKLGASRLIASLPIDQKVQEVVIVCDHDGHECLYVDGKSWGFNGETLLVHSSDIVERVEGPCTIRHYGYAGSFECSPPALLSDIDIEKLGPLTEPFRDGGGE